MAQKRRAKDLFHIRFEVNEKGGYTVTIPELPGCITEGDTFEEALDMVKDALAGWLYVAAKYDDPIPPPFEGVLEELKVKGS